MLLLPAVSQIESTVKGSMLALKNSFSFALPNLTLFTFWKRLSNRETKDHRGAQLQKRTSIEFPPLLMRSTFWFSIDSTLYLGHRLLLQDPKREKKKHRLFAYYILQKWTLNGWLMMTNALQLSKALRLWLVLRGETSSFWQLLLMMMIVW